MTARSLYVGNIPAFQCTAPTRTRTSVLNCPMEGSYTFARYSVGVSRKCRVISPRIE
jgi:hypothetical protein